MRTRASLAGHPVHPMIVVVPVGAFATSAVLDALALLAPAGAWWRASAWATGAGVLVLVAALVPGLVDFFTSLPDGAAVRGLAARHMALGFAITLVYAVVFALRAEALAVGRAPLAASAAGALGLLLVAVQVYWGTGLVTAHGVGTESDGGEAMR